MFGFGDSDKAKAKKRAKLIAQAQKNAAAARAEIGDETIQKLAQAMQKRQESASERAKQTIMAADKEKVADHIKWMIRDQNKD